MGTGQVLVSSGRGSTCDGKTYFDGGRACAWNTFLCEDYNNGIVPLSFPTCFGGFQQSPINLDKSEATVGDPGQITFSGYGAKLTRSPVYRLKSFTLQLDFKRTFTPPISTTTPGITRIPAASATTISTTTSNTSTTTAYSTTPAVDAMLDIFI